MTRRIAVLIASHNRRDTTRRCLESLAGQNMPAGAELETFLVDDASSDGTGEMVRSVFPQVHVVEGTGTLFWTGGTLLAEESARSAAPDFTLWLNDDVVLDRGAIAMLLEASARLNDGAIVVGSTCDPETAEPSYGGHVRRSKNRPFDLVLLPPNGSDQLADTMNGNVVLIPKAVRDIVGPLEKRLVHNAADHDYGFRATAQGIPIVMAPAYAGTCAFNDSRSKWLDSDRPFRERWRFLVSFRGLPPRQWLLYTKRHGGWLWPLAFVSPYIHCLLPRIRGRRRYDREG